MSQMANGWQWKNGTPKQIVILKSGPNSLASAGKCFPKRSRTPLLS